MIKELSFEEREELSPEGMPTELMTNLNNESSRSFNPDSQLFATPSRDDGSRLCDEPNALGESQGMHQQR